ncbi:MAG: YjgP/YjgQ family permease [Deltaproteobacteria bacterium]|nr:MAG: YjgP/YjgQ family permease [Deltaproteobacteria bacterium]
MFKIYQRYLAATFIPPFVMASAFFVFFLMTFQFFRFTPYIVAKGVDWNSLLHLLAYMGLMFLPFAMPLAVLLATIYTLNKLSEDSEIVAMRAFGASKERLFMPFLVLGLLIAGTLFSLNRQVIPFAKREVRNSLIKFASSAMLNRIRPAEFFADIPGLTIYASSVSEDGRDMSNLFLFMKDKKTGEEKIIFSKGGALVGGKNNIADLKIELTKGSIVRLGEKTGDLEKISFDKYTFPAFKKVPGFGSYNKASVKSNKDLRKEIKRTEVIYKERLKTGKDIEGKRKDYHVNLLEYWSRFNTPLVILGCIFLGFGVGIKNGRGKDKNSALLAMMVLIPYYALFFWGISLAKNGPLWPSVAVFVPTLFFFVAGYWFYRRMDWVN